MIFKLNIVKISVYLGYLCFYSIEYMSSYHMFEPLSYLNIGIIYDLTARKQCTRRLSSSMILLNRNELIPLIVGLPMVK